jgi:hypothetical protein
MKKILFLVLSLFTIPFPLFTLFGCGYTLHGKVSLPFDAIKIDTIENRTFEPKLQDRLHKALAKEFLKHGVEVRQDAELKLSGVIHTFELRILSEKSDIASEYEVIIQGDFTLQDPSGRSKEFKDVGSPFIVSFSGAGPLEELIASKETASEKAIADMAMEIIGMLFYIEKE